MCRNGKLLAPRSNLLFGNLNGEVFVPGAVGCDDLLAIDVELEDVVVRVAEDVSL